MSTPPDECGPAPAPAPAQKADCCLFRPGHGVHWIQVSRSLADTDHPPQPGRLVSVAPDGLVLVEVDDEVRRLWNHQPERLEALVAADDGAVTHQPRWGLLRTPSPGGPNCFCVTRADDPDRPDCTPTVDGDTVVEWILAAGCAALSVDELRTALDEFDDRAPAGPDAGTGSGGPGPTLAVHPPDRPPAADRPATDHWSVTGP